MTDVKISVRSFSMLFKITAMKHVKEKLIEEYVTKHASQH